MLVAQVQVFRFGLRGCACPSMPRRCSGAVRALAETAPDALCALAPAQLNEKRPTRSITPGRALSFEVFVSFDERGGMQQHEARSSALRAQRKARAIRTGDFVRLRMDWSMRNRIDARVENKVARFILDCHNLKFP